MNPYIENIKRFLIDYIKRLELSMDDNHLQAQRDSQEAINFCKLILESPPGSSQECEACMDGEDKWEQMISGVQEA